MKWLILSDSHGVISNMKQAVIRSSPDGILHLGDCWQDGQRLHQLFPQLPFYQVPGNCDFRPDVPSERVLKWKDSVFCSATAIRMVSSSPCCPQDMRPRSRTWIVFLFGHTHRPLVDRRGKTLFLNPGSIGDPLHPFYGEVLLEPGHLDGRTVELPRV